jgi:hypothetical protein
VAEPFKVWAYGRSLAGNEGSNSVGGLMSVSCECCVLSGRGLCDGPIPRREESYRVCESGSGAYSPSQPVLQ